MAAQRGRRRTALLTAAAVAAFGVSLFFLVFGEAPEAVRSSGADSFSRSALGYRGLVELLEEDRPVVVSRHRSPAKVGPGKLLLLPEPELAGYPDEPGSWDGSAIAAVVEEGLAAGATVLVVVPKWRAVEVDEEGWVERIEPVRREWAEAVMVAALRGAGHEIEPPGLRRGGSPPRVALSEPRITVATRLPAAQLAYGEHQLRVLAGEPGSWLIARSELDPGLILLSDPDLLNNAGLGQGDNALLAHWLLNGAMTVDAVVIDEVLGGFARRENLWRALLEPPLVYPFLHLGLVALLVVWIATVRFGPALPPPRRLAPGKATLIGVTARLLGMGGHSSYALGRYLEDTVRRAAAAFSLPANLGGPPGEGGLRRQVTRLAELGERRGAPLDLEQLAAEIRRLPAKKGDPQEALGLARSLYRWRQEMIDGAGTDRSPR